MNPTIIGLSLLVVIMFTTIDLTRSECCHVPLKCTEGSKSVERCYDCTEATVYCGIGKCNLLGCNCDGGCRAGDSSLWCWNLASNCHGKYFSPDILPQSDQTPEQEFFNTIDTDSNGKLDFDETNKYISKYGPRNVNTRIEFRKLDTNRDGFLTINEIDGY